MNQKIAVLVAEIGASLCVGYLTLTEHDRSRIRMMGFRSAAKALRTIARITGGLAIDCEQAYNRETISNG